MKKKTSEKNIPSAQTTVYYTVVWACYHSYVAWLDIEVEVLLYC